MKIEGGGKNPHYLMLLFINIWASTVDRETRISLPVHIFNTVYT